MTPSGPWPQTLGILSSCKISKLAYSSDNCYGIDNAKGIRLSRLLSCSSYADPQLNNLRLGYYISWTSGISVSSGQQKVSLIIILI